MADSSYYAKKKAESDKKIQDALNARKARTTNAESSQAKSKEASDSKISDALAARTQRVQNSLSDIFADINKALTVEMDSYRGTKPTYGAYEDTYNSQRESRVNISKLRDRVNAYRNYMDSSVADDILSTLDKMESGYDAYLSLSEFDSEDDYNSWYASQKDKEQKLSSNTEALQKELDELTGVQEEYNRRVDTLKKYYLTNDYTFVSKEEVDEAIAYTKEAEEKYGITVDKTIDNIVQDKKLYLSEAKRLQEGAKLASVSGNADFADFSGYVGTEVDGIWANLTSQYGMGYDDLTYEYINGAENGKRKEILNKVISYSADTNLENADKWTVYDHMTEDEIGIYNYHYAKDGKEAAQKYLDSIQETLNARKAGKMYANMEDKTLLELAFGVAAGLDQFKSGAKGAWNAITGNDEYVPASATQMASGMVREDLADKTLPVWYNFKEGQWEEQIFGRSVGQAAYDTVTTTANMLPSIMTAKALSMINPVAGGAWISQVVGTGMMGASAAGNAYQEVINLGYDKDQARAYAALVGSSEAGLQYLLGGIGSLGGKLSNNVLTKIMNGVDNAFARTALKLGGNMFSEGLEEGLQEILTPWFQNLVLHTDNDVDWNEVAYSSLLGALTAGVMEGGGTIAGEVNTYKTGKNLQAADISAQRLSEIGKTFSADTVAYQLAGRVNENTGAYTMGRLFNEIGATLSEQNINEIANALVSKGMDEATARKNAKALAYVAEGGQLSDRQIAVIEGNEILAEVARTTLIDANTTWNQRSKGYNDMLKALADEMTSSKDTTTNAPATDTVDGQTENRTVEQQPESQYEVSAEGKAIDKKGNDVNIVGVESTADGKMVLKTENGTIDSSEVLYASKADALIYEAVSKLGARPASSWNMIKSFKESDGVSAQDYATLIPLAYKYGKINHRKGLLNLDLTPKQSSIAFQMGREDAAAAVKPTTQASTKSTLSEKNADKKIIFEGFAEREKRAIKGAQKASMAAIDMINKMSSLEIHVFKSYEKGGKLYAMVNGRERLAPNGYFTDGNKIYIDINAGSKGEGLMLFTLSHEIGHHIARYDAQDFQAISDFLFEHYGEDAPILDEIEKQKNKLIASCKMDGKAIPSDSVLERKAHEELVCDMLSRMLADKNAYDKLMELKQNDLNVFQKLGQAIKKVLDKIAKAIGLYDSLSPDFKMAASVENFGEEAFRQLQDMYIKAFVQADANFLAAQKNTTEDGGEIAYHKRQQKNLEDKYYARQIDQWDGEDHGGSFRVCSPSDALLAVGIPDVDIWLDQSKASKQLHGKVEVDKNVLKAIPGVLQNPTVIAESYDNSVVIFGELHDKFGHPIVVALRVNSTNRRNHITLVNKVRSVGTRNTDLDKLLSESAILYLNENKKETNQWFNALGRSTPFGGTKFGLIRSITFDFPNVNKNSAVRSESTENLDVEVDAKTESVAPSVLMSERTWTESDYVQERETAAKEIAKAIGVSVKKAKAYIDSVNSIAKMIAEDRVRLDYFSSPGRSSFVGNVEYGGSFDFSTLCKKRRLLTGTFAAIQKALPNTALTADEILDIRNRMKDAGLEVSCGLCYVEGSRANMGQFAKEFLRLYKQYYPDAWQPNMADVNTPDGIEWVRINHPECYEQYEYFWNHYGTLKDGDKNLYASQQKPKLYQLHTEYKGEILDKFNDDDNVEEKNLNGGIRLQSFSDFEIVHLIDTMQIIMDMSRVGLAGQAYTKVPDFAWALGDTGLKINLSLIAKGVDENGRLIFDDVEGMPIDKAVELRNRYSKNVGTILVAFNDEQLLAAMADERVDYIIPFHRSQWKKSQYSAMGLPAKTKDYTYMQNEKFIKPQYHEYRGRMVKDKATNYMPNEYWDFSKSGKENAEAYLEMCARNNKRPKFYKLLQNNGDGSYSLKADGSTDGYWKLLIDFKMYDNSGKGSPQMPVKPDFNMDEATRMLNDYSGGHSNFPVAQGVVDEFVQEYKDSHKGAKFSMRESVEETKDLLAYHNITAQLLLDVLKRNSLLMPSLAITNKGMTDFGEISLLFDKGSIDPIRNALNKLYGADAWTPTQTELKKNAKFDTDKTVRAVNAVKNRIGSKFTSDLFNVSPKQFKAAILKAEGSIYNAYAHDLGMQTAYAMEQGIISKIPTNKDGTLNRTALQEQVSKELDTDKGWRQYKKWLRGISDNIITSYDRASNQEILNDMKAQPATAKSFKLSESGELVVPAMEYSSIDEIRKNKNRLSENAAEATKVVADEFLAFAKKFGGDVKSVVNAINASFANRYSTADIVKSFNGKGIQISPEAAVELQSLYKKAVELPTQYFEAKPQREVGLDEVKAVVMPADASYAELKGKLEDLGISVVEYDGTNKSRVEALNSVESLKFSDRDSDGNQLSEDQQEFFAESKARDENGNLYVLFHGSRSPLFTEFGVDEGVWLTPDQRYAEVYAEMWHTWRDDDKDLTGLEQFVYADPDYRLYKMYANITNPLDIGEINDDFDRKQLNRLARLLGVPASQIKSLAYDEYGYETIAFVYQLTKQKEFIDIAREKGYDGFIATEKGKKTFCAFNAPNQVKLTTNEVPSTFHDIRYSDRDTAAFEAFGTTTNFEQAGFVLGDGRMLNLSQYGLNGVKHQRIEQVYDDVKGSDAINRFIQEGHVRIKASSPGIEIGTEVAPTVRQLNTISKFINTSLVKKGYFYLDITDKDGKSIASVEYDEDASAEDVIWDIKDYYDRGKVPTVRRTLFQDRDTDSVSNRSLLANAFEGVAQNDIERNKIQEYKVKIDLINAEEQKLSELNEQIKELSFAKGPRDTKKIRDLQFEARQTANRISTYDKQLLRLEASKPLQDVLTREKKMAYKRAEQKGKEALEAYREKTMKTQRELLEKWQESRKKGIDSRNRTAMRHKIKDIVNELNQYLLRGTKERHVPIELQKAVAEALGAVNMDTVGAEERIAKLKDELLKAKTPEQIQEISRKIDHIQAMGDKMNGRLQKLKDAYDQFVNSDDPLIANSHDEVISNKLQSVIDSIGNTPLRDMTFNQLEDVYDMYRMVLTTIRNANKAFKAKKNESISTIANQVMEEVEKVGGKKKQSLAMLNGIKSFAWNNLKPVYAFEHIGSDHFTEVFNNVRAGEDVWAVDVTEARKFYLDKSKKHNYDSWDFKKRYKFTSTSGMDFELDLEQIMSLYAYSKRDKASDHLKKGGIVFDESTKIIKKTKMGISLEFNPTEATAYNISEETLADIVSQLTNEQKGFVDEMQDYLSTVMGAKGNEVSLEMYGVKLFKEKFYFPLKSAQQFMAKAKEQQKGEVKIKNSGFSKETVPNASNPIVLTPFMNVWAGHVNDMSMYHAFVLPMEDFYRVYSYKTPASDTMATESVEMFIQNAYGKGATRYIDQLLKDLNGGARTDTTTGIINKGIGLFKKGAVFASLSVVIQQPSAIARAIALVDAKYFIGPKVDHKTHKALWEEVKQYAPVAIIKEMGYFDTNMGKSTQDFILGKEYEGFKEKMSALVTDSNYRDEVLSKAPSMADEIAWCGIWEAVKRELKAKNPGMDIKSEAFLKMAGERFTDVIVKTQVYDSALSRSGMMRSKDTGMKMATAFMAEPTTSINMIADALLQGKRGNKKYARAAIGAVIASQILNSILVSFVYAGRDDDEDETYWEKYIGTLSAEILDSLNPAGYIPFIKDIVSIVQGYEVERSDMAVISDLWKAWENLSKDNVSVYRKVEGLAGSIAQMFGLPLKNIMRDARGIYQTVNSFMSGQPTTGAGIGNAIKGAITRKDVSDSQQIYEAYLSGDTAQIARVNGRFKDQNAINNAIRKGLRENDPRIREAAIAWNANDLDEYMRIAKEIIAEKHFVQDDVVMAIRSEANELSPDAETETQSKAKGLFTAEKFAEAVSQGDQAMANAIKTDIIRTAQKNGKTAEEAEKSFNSSAKSELKDLFLAGKVSEDKAVKALVTYCDETEEDALETVGKWLFEDVYGFSYSDRADAYKSGKISASEMKTILMEEGGKTAEEADLQIEAYDWEAQGYKGATAAAVREYNEHCASTNVPKDVYLYIRTFSNNTENDKDANGKSIAYSAMKKIMAEINAQTGLTSAQKTAIARSLGWAEKNIQKYKTW